MRKPPVNYIISIKDTFLNEFIFWWIQHEKPCSLSFMKPKTEGLTAILITVDCDESAYFLMQAKERINFIFYDYEDIRKDKERT